MKKKEVLTIFLLAVLVTKLSVDSSFRGLVVFQLPSKLLGTLLFQFLFVILGPLLLEGPRWLETLAVLTYLFLQFLFWFLVLAGGWKLIKWVKGKYGRNKQRIQFTA